MKIHLKRERGGNNDYLISIFFFKNNHVQQWIYMETGTLKQLIQ